MRLARQLHLYIGVFFAPTIIFFAFTGFLQTYSLHEGPTAQPWITALEQIHTHQRRPSLAPTATPATAPANVPQASAPAVPQVSAPPPPQVGPSTTAAQTPPRPPRRKRSTPLRVFMGFMAVGLIGSSLVGVWMGFQLNRNTALVLGLLVAGTILPIVALYIGTQP